MFELFMFKKIRINKASLWITAIITSTLLMSACSKARNRLDEHTLSEFGQNKVLSDAKRENDYQSAADAGEESFFSLGSGDKESIFGSRGGKRTKETVRADKLFAAALDVVLELPVISASREGGFIATDWKVDTHQSDNRYRLNIRVSGRDPYGEVNVVVLKQQRNQRDTQWQDVPSDSATARNIEKAIRKRAQVVRP